MKGKVVRLMSVDSFVDGQVAALALPVRPWFSIDFDVVVKLLLSWIDALVVLVEKDIQFGPDKKATVLDALRALYDKFIVALLPLYLLPFNGLIKKLLIDILASHLIDFIVAAYNRLPWHPVPV